MDRNRINMEQEIVRTGSNIRLVIAAIIVVVTVAGVIFFISIQRIQMDILNQAEDSPELALERMKTLIGNFKALNLVLITLISIYFLYLAYRIYNTNIYPPPGVKVIRDTRILRGKPARARAFLLVFLVAVIIIVGLMINSYLEKIIGMLSIPGV